MEREDHQFIRRQLKETEAKAIQIVANKQNRPKATKRNYEPKQLEFKEWCLNPDAGGYPNILVNEDKLLRFINEELLVIENGMIISGRPPRKRGRKRTFAQADSPDGENQGQDQEDGAEQNEIPEVDDESEDQREDGDQEGEEVGFSTHWLYYYCPFEGCSTEWKVEENHRVPAADADSYDDEIEYDPAHIHAQIVEWINQHCNEEHDDGGFGGIPYRWDRKESANSIPFRPNAGSRTNPRTIDIKSIESYISAIIDLFHEQVRKGDNTPNNFPNTEALKRYKLTIKTSIGKFKNDSMEDRGIPNAGLKASEYKRLGDYFLMKGSHNSKQSLQSLSIRTFIFFLKDFMCRGQLPRNLKFSWISSRKLEREGLNHGGTSALRAAFNLGKKNQFGKIQHSACLRNIDVQFCSISSLALLFFVRYQLHGQPFPSFSLRSEWYETFLFPASRTNGEMPSSTIEKALKKAFDELSITSCKIEHIGRLFSALFCNEEGVNKEDIERQGLWLRDAAEGNYLEDAPAWKAMRVAAGFTQDRSTVFYPRDIQPPDSLLRKVFPFLDESILQYKGSAEQCMAGKDFLELMLFLRVVFLQDTAILIRMDAYRDHPMWNHSLFKDRECVNFHRRVQEAHDKNDIPREILLTRAMPALANKIDAFTSAIMHQQNSLSSNFDEMREELSNGQQHFNKCLQQQMDQQHTIAQKIDSIQLGFRIHNKQLANFHENAARSTFLTGSSDGSSAAAGDGAGSSSSADGAGSTSSADGASDIPLPPLSDANAANEEADSAAQNDASTFPSSSSSATKYTMNRALSTVQQAWDEYKVGIGGNPSIESLDRTYGKKWRNYGIKTKTSTEGTFYQRRMRLVNAIKTKMQSVSEAQAVQFFETAKGNGSLDRLQKSLK